MQNEAFNTLRNQGYHFEHGKLNLSVVMSMLMMLAFLLDQIQEEARTNEFLLSPALEAEL